MLVYVELRVEEKGEKTLVKNAYENQIIEQYPELLDREIFYFTTRLANSGKEILTVVLA